MKIRKITLLLIVVVLFSSCAQVYKFVQVFEATPINANATKIQNGGMLYEDSDCAIFYSFWAEGGDASFAFYNKTDQIIYIDLSKSFFIRNGIANDYYKEREWSEAHTNSTSYSYSNSSSIYGTKSFSYGASATYLGNFGSIPLTTKDPLFSSATANRSIAYGALYSASQANAIATSKSSAMSIKETKIIAIPPKSSKIIAEYSISNILLVDCDLQRYPSEFASLSFDEEDSPLIFENYISYRKGDSEQDIIVENKFYISKITNYAKPYLHEYVERTEKPCQNVTSDESKKYDNKYPVKVFDEVITINTDNCFYLEYKKTSNRTLYKKSTTHYYYNSLYEGYTQGESSQTQSGFLLTTPKK